MRALELDQKHYIDQRAGEVAEWLKAPHSKFGDGDAFADDPVLIRLNKLTLSSTGQRRGASLSCSVLSRWVAKW